MPFSFKALSVESVFDIKVNTLEFSVSLFEDKRFDGTSYQQEYDPKMLSIEHVASVINRFESLRSNVVMKFKAEIEKIKDK